MAGYTREDFEKGKCPECGSADIDEERNIANIADPAGYLLDFPFGPNYKCNKCNATNEGDECFIASTVYGDRNAPQVQALRKFRDEVLMNSSAGRSFVSFYYSGAGEKTAEFIENHLPSTIPTIRKSLDFLVSRISD
ncbi:MAG: CFI-box-CTERM domain-containing protein [archaeon]